MPAEQFADHFTPLDRERLIGTSVRLDGLKEDFAELKQLIALGAVSSATKVDKLEERIRTLEQFRWWIVGAAPASGSTAGFFSRFFHTT